MDDDRIRSMFFEHLKDKDPNYALVAVYQEVSKDLLAKMYEGQTVDSSVWEMILKITRAVAQLNLYFGFTAEPPGTQIVFKSRYFAEISLLFRTWRDTISYLIDNFDLLLSEKLKDKYTVDSLKMILAEIDKEIAESTQNVATSGTISVDSAEFGIMAVALRWGLMAIMGDERFEEFSTEFDRHLAFMKVYYFQVVSAPAKGG